MTVLSDSRLRVSEVFFSLQGEASRVGLPTVFIRLTGCPLRCGYCDTAYAFQGGEWRTVAELLAETRGYPTRHVTVSGGEPLAQKSCLALLTALCDAGLDVSLETSGALDIGPVDARVARIVDVKTPGSGEVARNLWANLELLTPRDEVKFVLTGETDYLWARELLREKGIAARCPVLFSPAWGGLEPARLAEWVLRDGLPVRMQVQLHKLLWSEARGR
ncbi:MAG: 7-carboxy-7-deazaguanine synthase QueE [Pseudomonadota bacterium]|nr:7-carboxy-7-deazaguanine synthase QueE [Pseudomonadota bacterium]MDP1905640.1 7-carboxy-7-deazaguanine synthase QueE [Pseudomonadota bacterium]MDP2353299.1 7-carboxy-7-deazaguanine synthase QueE [Pseudomonadota bacterium]